MKRNIINNFKQYQNERLSKFKNTKNNSLSSRIKRSAQSIGITPTVQLLIEAIGDTIEADDEQNTENYDMFDISDILMDYDSNNGPDENFHDTTESIPTPTINE